MKPAWKCVLDAVDPKVYLPKILKTRRRLIEIGLNGGVKLVPRAQVRDYLKSKV